MPTHALNHINIRAPRALVADLKDFYVGVVGLEEGWRPPFSSTGHWLYLGVVPVVHLVEDETVERSASRGTREPVIDHVSFSCTDLRSFEAQLAARRVAFRRTGVAGTPIVQLNFLDPAGNGVELQFADSEA
jgi:catechol 2,3-dioxygenase-like lactoylglutathione lyase family enzyme